MYGCRLVIKEFTWGSVPAPINIILFYIKRENFTEELSVKTPPNNYSMVIMGHLLRRGWYGFKLSWM